MNGPDENRQDPASGSRDIQRRRRADDRRPERRLSEKPPRNLFAELKRRNVIRMAGLYLVGSWLVVQVVGTVLPMFAAPEWIARSVVIVLAIGFVPAIVLSWVFELTADGLLLDSGVQASANPSPLKTARRMDRAIILILAAALLYFAIDKFVIAPDREATQVADVKDQPKPVEHVAVVIDPRSIAVLPFENLSSDPDNAYFAVGIQDEILTRLAKIGSLKVISRTSTQHYDAKPGNLPEIALELGVAHIVEGSVQRIGAAVHINVQLIRAATDEHLWAESYDRQLDDVFGVEGEVARAIAVQLDATLSGAETAELGVQPTLNAQAYDAYLHGIALAYRADGFAPNTTAAIAALEQAVRLDPEFALAWALLSREHAFAYWVFDPSFIHKEGARKALEKTMRLAPDAVETISAHGYYRYWVDRDRAAAKLIFERLRAGWPNDGEATYALAAIARRDGHWEDAVRLFARANEIDPRNVQSLTEAAFTLIAMRKPAAAKKIIDRALNVAPDDPGVLAVEVLRLQEEGKLEEAQRVLDHVRIDQGNEQLVSPYVINAILLRRYSPAIALVESQLEDPKSLGVSLGNYLSSLGDLQRAAGDASAARRAYENSLVAYRKAQADDPDFANFEAGVAMVEAGLGHKQEALRSARRGVQLMPSSADALLGPVFEETLARVHARFGDIDTAFEILQRLIDLPYEGSPPITPATLRLDPDWDTLRVDPRFDALLSKGERVMQAGREP